MPSDARPRGEDAAKADTKASVRGAEGTAGKRAAAATKADTPSAAKVAVKVADRAVAKNAVKEPAQGLAKGVVSGAVKPTVGTSAKLSEKSKTRRKPASFDDYVSALAPDKREAVQQLRAAILSVAPTAEECISYDLPAFRIDGKVIAWIGAASSHIAMYGVAGLSLEDLAAYDTSGKGTLRFPVDRPLPLALVRRIVQARIARNSARR